MGESLRGEQSTQGKNSFFFLFLDSSLLLFPGGGGGGSKGEADSLLDAIRNQLTARV